MIGEYKIVGLCMSRIQETFSHDFIIEFSEVLKKAGYRLFVYNACSDLANDDAQNNGQKYTYDLIHYSFLDALVVYEDRIRNRAISDSIIAKGLQNKVPVIVLGDAHPGCMNIASNDPLGMEKMVRHLIEDHQLTKLHFIAGIKDEHYSDERIFAFQHMLKEHNIPFTEDMLSYGEYWAGPTEAAVERIIESGSLPEAFVCVNDHTALTVCSVLKRHNISVPKKVKVTGYDGLFETRMSNPTLSTVNCSIHEYAKQTLLAIDDVLAGKEKEKTILFEPELWRFASCGCGKHQTTWAPEYIISLKDNLYRFHTDNEELAEISAHLQRCEDPLKLSEEMISDRLYDMTCVIDMKFLNEEFALSDYQDSDMNFSKNNDYFLLYDSEEEPFIPRKFSLEEVCPKFDFFLRENRPLVFTALSYLNLAMGYICFFYPTVDVPNLLIMPQITTFIGTGIGGYINMRHEHFLNTKIERMYRTDSLTGLFNRRGFALEYQKILGELKKTERMTVVLADVDGLKKINDKFGHAEGDVSICTVADALRKACPKDTIAVRFGGDEMLAVCRGAYEAKDIQNRFDEYLRQWNEAEKRPYNLHASVGIYVTQAGAEPEFEELILQADKLMYLQKEKGKAERKDS